MRTYTIVINDAQREYLLTVLKQCQAQGHFGAGATEREEIDMLHAMFDHLEQDEKENPGAVHSFCY